MDASGVQANVTRPFSTSTTRVRVSSVIGGGGKCPSTTVRQYVRPDIDATVACVAIGSCQVTNRDCSAIRASSIAVMSGPTLSRKLIGVPDRANIAGLPTVVNRSVYYLECEWCHIADASTRRAGSA